MKTLCVIPAQAGIQPPAVIPAQAGIQPPAVIPAQAGIQSDMEKQFAVYILSSRRNGTLYIGVTSNLPKRLWEHREGVVEGFTKEYGVKTLVWFELAGTMHAAITRETRHKNRQRQWKIALIEAANPEWHNLAEELGLPSLGV